jgi:hypothetical protein
MPATTRSFNSRKFANAAYLLCALFVPPGVRNTLDRVDRAPHGKSPDEVKPYGTISPLLPGCFPSPDAGKRCLSKSPSLLANLQLSGMIHFDAGEEVRAFRLI